ncbi:hypothetical protein CsSME_00021607 [Camellia sinensis var. sinensis]|uniref:uncharacterized protein LOC114293839 n=1 Tax=Camellia sinensis TaxID=4442 RepID=UPI001035802E|nr:uncharacterized protein LOC114293839 [Camellia sinensis]XP_028093763.1 uncharacterized protein LOC114293839 [Camellia sinensis]
MECNRDEAVRAKQIAEKKFMAKDILGAKKFTIKAQTLYPSLEGIQHMLATLDVYIAAENRINGEEDRYGILGVNPLANEDTIRKHYRKLALMLHPDKNKSIGADGAFKLISEAWSLLSDKAKRLAYDQKRNVKGFQQKVPPASAGTSAPPRSNGFNNFTKSTTPHVRVPKGNTTKAAGASHGPPPSHKQKPRTFWTVCHRCKMQYEYLRMYLNHNLLCPNCHEPFFAVETAPPSSKGYKASTQSNHSQQQQNTNHQGASKNVHSAGRNNSANPNVGSGGFSSPDSSNHANFQWAFSRTAGASSVAQAATVVQHAYEKVKREREEAQAATKREEALRRKNQASKRTGGVSSANSAKRRKSMEDHSTMKYGSSVNQMGMGSGGAGMTGLYGVRQGNSVPGLNKPRSVHDLSPLEIQNLLMDKTRKEIRKKLNEWDLATVATSAVKSKENVNEKADEEVKEKDNAMVNGAKQDKCKTGENENLVNKSTHGSLGGVNENKEPLEPMSINVPDPDFHDFDKDRTERCFGENQVWAAYDDDDGMPRYYAMIHNVVSLNPFKMRISWLNSKTNSELGPLNWVGSGFAKTCGDFRIGKHEINNSLNSFSHKVRWTKGARGVVCIFPRKGEVWALYRNWTPEWNELTADEAIHKYDMAEVLEDYDEGLGVTVTPLVKVAGFKTVFHQHLDPRKVRRIPREEMFRFSHHVPSYLLTGQEAPNAPKGCRELDPAATPLELLLVIPDVKEEDIVGDENEENAKVEKVVDDVGKPNNEETEENSSKFSEKISGNKTREPEEVEILEDSWERREDEKVNSTEVKIDS